MKLFSPAKLNLFFRVLRKREDGFHEIASLFQAIDLGDTLEFDLSEEDCFTCSDPSLSLGEDNLVRKARRLFCEKTGWENPLRCHLTKRIPTQAGVGGGSSNAATTLYACNELAGRLVSNEQLKTWAKELGSDVAFFFSSGSAYCTGRGEKIEEAAIPLEKIFSSPCFLAKPAFGLSTPEVYRACRPEQLEARDPKESLESFKQGRPHWYNDLEPAALSISQAFQDYMNSLRGQGFSQVVLTGSGSGAFCFGRSKAPQLPHIQFYPINPLARNSEGWYP